MKISHWFLMMSLFPILGFAHPRFHCSGTEPFWGLTLGKTYTFEREGQTYTLATVKPSHSGNQWIYHTHTNNMQSVTITVKKQNCSNGMSDQTFPYEVTYQMGNQTFNGCCTAKKPNFKGE